MWIKIILASLLALVSYWWVGAKSELDQQNQIIKLQTKQLDTGAALVQEFTLRETKRLDRFLEDDAKAKYRPIQQLVHEVQGKIRAVLKEIEWHRDSTKETRCIEREYNELVGMSHRLIEASKATFDISLNLYRYDWTLNAGLIERISSNESLIQAIDDIQSILNKIEKHPVCKQKTKLLSTLNLALQHFSFRLSDSYIGIAGGPTISCYFHRPYAIYLLNDTVKAGETYEIMLFFPDFSFEKSKNLSVKIDGKQQYQDAHGVIHYTDIHKIGKDSISIEYEMINPLTGEVWDGKSACYFN